MKKTRKNSSRLEAGFDEDQLLQALSESVVQKVSEELSLKEVVSHNAIAASTQIKELESEIITMNLALRVLIDMSGIGLDQFQQELDSRVDQLNRSNQNTEPEYPEGAAIFGGDNT